jgi:hypothetical protein
MIRALGMNHGVHSAMQFAACTQSHVLRIRHSTARCNTVQICWSAYVRFCNTASLHSLVSQAPVQRQGWGPKAPEGLDRHEHEGQGGGYLPMRAPLGGVPGSSRKPGGARSVPSKGRSRQVDDGTVSAWACKPGR